MLAGAIEVPVSLDRRATLGGERDHLGAAEVDSSSSLAQMERGVRSDSRCILTARGTNDWIVRTLAQRGQHQSEAELISSGGAD